MKLQMIQKVNNLYAEILKIIFIKLYTMEEFRHNVKMLVENLEDHFKEKDSLERKLERKIKKINELKEELDGIYGHIDKFDKKQYSDEDREEDSEEEYEEYSTDEEEDRKDEDLYGKRDNLDYDRRDIIDKPRNRRILKRMESYRNRDNQDPIEQREKNHFRQYSTKELMFL